MKITIKYDGGEQIIKPGDIINFSDGSQVRYIHGDEAEAMKLLDEVHQKEVRAILKGNLKVLGENIIHDIKTDTDKI